MIKAVAFDFDGVLVGLDTHTNARKQAFEEFASSTGDGRFIATDETHQDAHLHGSHPEAIIGWVLQQQGLVGLEIDPTNDPLTKQVVGRKKELYLDMVSHGLDALDGSIECVRWASDKFTPSKVAIVTTASQAEVDPFLRRHNLENEVGFIVTKEDVGDKLKPNPQAYSIAAQRFGLSSNECAAIEDSVRGLEAARLAGFITIGITTTHTAEQLNEHSDHIVKSFREIQTIA